MFFAELDGWKPGSPEFMGVADPEYIDVPTRGVEAFGGPEEIAAHIHPYTHTCGTAPGLRSSCHSHLIDFPSLSKGTPICS